MSKKISVLPSKIFRLTQYLFILFFVGTVSIPAYANLENNHWVFHWGSENIQFLRSSSSQRGTPMIALEDILKKFQLKMSFHPADFEIVLENPTNKAQFKLKTYSVDVEGSHWKAKLSRPIEFKNAKALVPIDFGDRALRPLLTGTPPVAAVTSAPPSQADVVIDPGHGGNDFGATVKAGESTYHEKDLVLQIAKELRMSLSQRGITSALTRENDAFLTLPERTRFANQLKPKIFISMHLNAEASLKSKSSGFEIYVLSLSGDDSVGRATIARENQMIPEDSEDDVSRALADLRATANLEASLEAAKIFKSFIGKNTKEAKKSIQMGPFYVLYGADMPALLLELGYLTSEIDRGNFLNDSKRSALVDSLTSALAQQLKKGIKKP
jgi:N-acetylmuramoyl-L-alanine amidase